MVGSAQQKRPRDGYNVRGHGAEEQIFDAGRTIALCERWDDFRAFLADMGEKPGPEYTLDRIDPWGHYEPSNCRWVTPDVQAKNKRRHHRKDSG